MELTAYLTSNLLTHSQHDFINKRPTVTNFFCETQFIFESLVRCGQVDVIYPDFSVASESI